MLELCKKNDSLSEKSKAGILEIHSNLLVDLNEKMQQNSDLDLGQYMNML